jgi:cysteinyl-tRNA synthetase
LEANRAALRRLDEFYLSLKECAADESVNDELPDWAFEGRNQFVQEMDDDMNISGALAALFHIVHTGNIELKNNNISSSQALALLQLWSELDTVLGLLIPKKEEIPIDIIALADLRIIARNEKNWAESDRLRDEILSQGWFIKDAAEGYKLRKIK